MAATVATDRCVVVVVVSQYIVLSSGRKHQLRVHCATLLDAPIVGDSRYGDPPNALPGVQAGRTPLFLHARRLRLPHPDASKGRVEVEAPAPSYWAPFVVA